ncbi:MAG: M20/M25/M40 family metallo-hydrolase [Alphaproteobacteria bacterium]|nr:M20/M25/M40 family metallo-hydrolase [Alphaproteobacteria bacterium]
MSLDAATRARVLAGVSRERLVDLTCAMVDIPSPTGHEAEVARFLVDTMREAGLKAHLQDIGEGRFNAIGVLKGSGNGVNLLLNGHIDTSYSGKETVLTGGGYKTKSYIVENEWIYGAGSNNMKSAIAGYVEAARAIKAAGVTLPGDVIIAGVSGEIETGAVDEFQGCDYAGHGIGTIHLLRHGLAADCAIIGEPTGFQVTPWHFGTVWVAFRTKGTMSHIAWMDRAVNAIDKSMIIYEALKNEWIEPYRQRNAYEGMLPNVSISAIRGGWPWRVSRVPVFCDIFMDVRLSPAMTIVELHEELAQFLAGLKKRDPGLDAEFEFYCAGPGTAIAKDSPVVTAITAAHTAVFGKAPASGGVNYYSDAVHLNRYDVPTVNYGLSGRLRNGGDGFDPAEGEHTSIGDLVAGTKVYALATLDIAGRRRGMK